MTILGRRLAQNLKNFHFALDIWYISYKYLLLPITLNVVKIIIQFRNQLIKIFPPVVQKALNTVILAQAY